jgi:hypothetical protein
LHSFAFFARENWRTINTIQKATPRNDEEKSAFSTKKKQF